MSYLCEPVEQIDWIPLMLEHSNKDLKMKELCKIISCKFGNIKVDYIPCSEQAKIMFSLVLTNRVVNSVKTEVSIEELCPKNTHTKVNTKVSTLKHIAYSSLCTL